MNEETPLSTPPVTAHRHTVNSALHIDEMDAALRICDEVVDVAGPQSIVRITSGVTDFAVDAFDDLPDGSQRLRQACNKTARLVASVTTIQDGKLADVRTGQLIRVVLHGERGAVYCLSVVPGQYIVGFTIAPAPDDTDLSKVNPVHATDEAISALVGRLRNRMGLTEQNPGSFHRRGETRSDRSLPPAVAGQRDRAEFGLMEAEVDPADLHLAALMAPGDELVVDQLGHPQLSRFFGLIGVEARRKFYAEFARDLPKTAGQLGRLVRTSVGGSLVRLVLDVEQGAVYWYRLGAGRYLMGVTLDQEQVEAADDKMARLARRLS
jgi:hypothetical protein